MGGDHQEWWWARRWSVLAASQVSDALFSESVRIENGFSFFFLSFNSDLLTVPPGIFYGFHARAPRDKLYELQISFV